MHKSVHESTTNVVKKTGAIVHVCAHAGQMSVTEDLRRYLREAHRASGKGVLAFENALGFPKSALKAVLSDQYNQVPSLDKAERIAEALGLELYLGPPRLTGSDSPIPSPLVLGPADVRDVHTDITSGGRVSLEVVIGPLGKAQMMLTPEEAKNLADQLTHRAMQIEEKG